MMRRRRGRGWRSRAMPPRRRPCCGTRRPAGLHRSASSARSSRAVARELAEEGASAAAERAADAALATLACHSVVRVGQRLDPAEVRALLADMDGVDVAAHCPHGRPVAVTLERAQLEALFKR